MSERKIADAPEIDAHVGRRVRVRRKMLGISQEGLADGLGLTFQQVQKYEKGSNRISASKLYQIAHLLAVPVAYFYEGLKDPGSPGGDAYATAWSRVMEDLLAEPNGQDLAEAFVQIRRRGIKRGIVDLIREIAREDQEGGRVDSLTSPARISTH